MEGVRYGISCWPYGDSSACDRVIEDRPLEGHESFMARAGKEGWVIGHYDGQAYYCCPEHRDGVWDPSRLVGFPTREPMSTRIRRAVDPYKAGRRRRSSKTAFRQFRHVDRHGLNYLTKHPKFWKGWAELRQQAREKARR